DVVPSRVRMPLLPRHRAGAGLPRRVLSGIRRPPPRSTLFPYTTLFRSLLARGDGELDFHVACAIVRHRVVRGVERGQQAQAVERSEEHTSELQSPYDLVCRLLLEKKKPADAARGAPPAARTRVRPCARP